MIRRARTKIAFSLIELMIAIVFIVIAFFGYVALHARILHSGQRLEEKEQVRAATDFYSGMLVARAMLDMHSGPDGKAFEAVPELPGVWRLDTSKPLHISWLTENILLPKEYSQGMDNTMQLSPQILATPYRYTWEKR
jgi:hypothetical protein